MLDLVIVLKQELHDNTGNVAHRKGYDAYLEVLEGLQKHDASSVQTRTIPE